MTKITYIPSEIANAAIDENGKRKPVTRTQHIFDDSKGKSQAEVNKDIDDTLAFHQSEINALDSQNYVTVDTFEELPATGALDTIYRVANYDGTQVVTNKYAEYAWNGTEYHLMAVRDHGIATKEDFEEPDSAKRAKLPTVGAVADVFGSNIENQEFVYVKVDAHNKILWAIKTDGNIYYGAGVPQQVIEYINENIVDFLAELEKGDKTLQDLLDEKVDKEEGKGLVDEEYAEGVNYIENLEFVHIETDKNKKLLSGRDKEGILHEYKGIETPIVMTDNLSLSEEGMNKLQKELKDSGFGGWSVDVDKLYPTYKYNVIFKSLKKRSKLRADEGGQGKQEADVTPFILLHFSDMHGQDAILSRILEFRNIYSAYITDTIHTGDTVKSYFENDFSFWSDNANTHEVLQVIGNHDVWTDGNHGVGPAMTKYSEEACFKRYFIGYENDDWQDESKLMSDNPISKDWDAELTYGKCYYYKDYNSSKIRLIVIDTNHYSSTQDAWVENLLNDTLTNMPDYHVIIAGHHFPKYKAIDTPFNTLNPVIDSYSRAQVIAAVDNFITNGGHFVCWLCGHSHRDQFGYVIDNNQEYPNQTVICVNTCKVNNLGTDNWTDTIRIDDTISQDCFNLFKVDSHEGYLTLYRVGTQYDQHLQKKEMIIYDYINNKVIYQC